MSCGAALSPTCPSCGAENPPAAKFCIECGTGLGAGGAGVVAPPPGTTPQPPSTPGVAAQAAPPAQRGGLFGGQLPGVAAPAWGSPGAGALPEERRKATVLFADLSGYTAVAERMDPEAVKSIVDRALRRLGQEVVRYGGSVDKYIGDNVMAVFGAPVSHEDDPERAVRAGLAMQAAMEEINKDMAGAAAEAAGANFLLRVGINSGEVLAGQVGDGYTVMGDAVNVAARLQAAARPGSVTVGEITHRLTRDAIEYAELEPLTLKGKSEPVPAWEAARVLDPGPATRGARSEAPLIGREDESALLMSLFDRVGRESRPHLVTVIGQAGVGKSRLLRELEVQIERADGEAGLPGRALPRLWRRARLLGARRDPPRASSSWSTPTIPSWPGRSSSGGSSRSSPTPRPTSRRNESPRRSPARSASSRRPSTRCPPASMTWTTRSRPATACSPRCAPWSRR